MKISVVIPTRHRDDLLALCLDRLAPGAQTLPADHYEVIVTDDGSASTAEAMVRARYPWARWVAGPRRGPAANRNHGAAGACGEWVAFTDDDCLPSPGWLQAYADAIGPAADVYEGRTTCEGGVPSPLYQSPINLTGGWLWSCNMMVKASLFQMLNGFYEGFPYAFMEDTDFRERLRARGLPFVFVPHAIVDHPARPILFGAKRARIHECYIIADRLWNRPSKSIGKFLYDHAKDRARGLIRSPLSFGSLVAALSAAIELATLARDYPRWLRKYRYDSLPVHAEALMGPPPGKAAAYCASANVGSGATGS